MTGSVVRLAGLAALAGLVVYATPTVAHHVGTWTPRDNEISANFKQLKFSMQARKFDIALGLYEQGALRKELIRRTAALPPDLDDSVRTALRAGDAREAERGFVLLFALLIHDLAREAERQVGDLKAARPVRLAAGRKFLEAMWRYYNLVDFAITQRDPKAATSVRLAFDEAEGSGKGSDPGKMLEPLRQIARIFSSVIEAFATPTRRES